MRTQDNHNGCRTSQHGQTRRTREQSFSVHLKQLFRLTEAPACSSGENDCGNSHRRCQFIGFALTGNVGRARLETFWEQFEVERWIGVEPDEHGA